MRGDRLSRCEQCVHFVRSGTAFLTSHLGLVALVVGYTVMGGFAFEAIEKTNEQSKRDAIMEKRANVVDTLWVITEKRLPLLKEMNWTKEAEQILIDFEKTIIKAMKTEGYDGLDEGQLQWSFPGALFFSIIVITTIGYGNIAPKTKEGKLLTILYAIVGIPLLLLCLSSIGDIMANCFKFIYWKVCCYLCVQPKKRHKIRRHRISSEKGQMDEFEKSPPGSPMVEALDKTHYFNNRFVHDYSPSNNSLPVSPASALSSSKDNREQMKYDSLYTTKDVSNVPIIPNKYVLQTDNDLPVPSLLNIPALKSQASLELPKVESDQGSWSRRDHTISDDDSDSEITENEVDEITVPVFLCVLVVIAYIIVGGVLFKEWEGWPFEDSCYFCFVTLTTIGFGDMVPGDTVMSQDENHLSLIACSLYLLFGMALIAMSFNLVQEKVTKSLKEVGKRIGILSSDDDDN